VEVLSDRPDSLCRPLRFAGPNHTSSAPVFGRAVPSHRAVAAVSELTGLAGIARLTGWIVAEDAKRRTD
jgi:hypothetical protein